MNKSESIVEISKAMAKFQAEVKQPFKDANNPFFKSKYVPLESVVESITSIAPKHGISFVQWASNDDAGRVGVSTMIMHTSGEYIEFDPVYMNADKNTAQGAGALISYLKRYSLSAVFGITSDQDDDGNHASGNTNKPKQQPNPKSEQKQQPKAKPEQIGHLKTKIKEALQVGKKGTTERDIMNWLKISEYESLTEAQINPMIKSLNEQIEAKRGGK
ncbi:ERF family protein [Mammaliicoccus sciuri]|uniref:ERF family protein n=1 Tax=Mammaliicoccus sciuri TaxID=1296 RepID=UPI001FB38C8B|nr:ERF family protein [Mammaliicoccus sciuri]MCJ1765863.1 ERF family protein [Mammaliicoccus sciuri]